ncbi:hypothetical protein C0V73_22730 [Rhizobium sp. TH135]|nr:hypothetical protein C0V73_22730 [Rhizobium sp. TH135]
MSWTALKSLVEAADLKAKGATILAEAIQTCGSKGMLYGPSHEAKDANGCVAVKGMGCDFAATGICSPSKCEIRYLDQRNGRLIRATVPDTWEDGDVYSWRNKQTENNFIGAQCRDGKIIRFGTGT